MMIQSKATAATALGAAPHRRFRRGSIGRNVASLQEGAITERRF
jgi:hypothetical protein